MKDHTIYGIRRPSPIEKIGHKNESRYLCNMDHCEAAASDRVGIALCERHIEKAWAAYQVLQGADVPEMQPDPERDVKSLDALGTVYIIRVGDLIKIGWTSSPKTRMRELKPDAILHYFPGTRRDEFRLHGQCIDHLVKGREWFASSDGMLAFVKSIRSGKVTV